MEKKVDWSKSPQLVEFIDNSKFKNERLVVVVLNGYNEKSTFEGLVLIDETNPSIYSKNKHRDDFCKEYFKPFHEELLIKK